MRVIIFVLLVVVEVFGITKEEAIRAVETKYNDLQTKYTNVKNSINVESEKRDGEQEKLTRNEISKVFQDTSSEFLLSVSDNTKTALAKGKPLTAIECLVKVSLEGNQFFKQTKEGFEKALPEVLTYKKEKLSLVLYESELIKTAITELKDTALKKFEEKDAPLETLKNDVLKKFETAKKQFEEIESQIPKPVLGEMYLALRKQFEAKFKETKETSIKKLQKCVA